MLACTISRRSFLLYTAAAAFSLPGCSTQPSAFLTHTVYAEKRDAEVMRTLTHIKNSSSVGRALVEAVDRFKVSIAFLSPGEFQQAAKEAAKGANNTEGVEAFFAPLHLANGTTRWTLFVKAYDAQKVIKPQIDLAVATAHELSHIVMRQGGFQHPIAGGTEELIANILIEGLVRGARPDTQPPSALIAQTAGILEVYKWNDPDFLSRPEIANVMDVMFRQTRHPAFAPNGRPALVFKTMLQCARAGHPINTCIDLTKRRFQQMGIHR